MSSREPMWYCHECHAEMRPLMQPDPHCASCHGTFVEQIENPQDDPREFDRAEHDFGEDMPGIPPILLGLLSGMGPAARPPRSPTSRSGGTGSSPGSPVLGGNGFRFEMTSGVGPNARSFVFGGPNRLGRDGRPEPLNRDVPSFMRRADEPPTPGGGHEISGPMMAQYLMALLGGRGDPFGALLGGDPGSGRWGDYAFSQEALDQIVSELMENSNAHRPVPASDEVVDKLPREVLEEGSPILEKDCAVCKEQFKLGTEDPDEQVVITLPCKHPFHQPCILPWLKTSGTCPVCRHALVPQPEHHGAPGAPATPGASSSSSRPPNPARPSPPGNSGGSGLLDSLLGFIRPSSTSNSGEGAGDQGASSSTSTGRNPNVPGGWRDS